MFESLTLFQAIDTQGKNPHKRPIHPLRARRQGFTSRRPCGAWTAAGESASSYVELIVFRMHLLRGIWGFGMFGL